MDAGTSMGSESGKRRVAIIGSSGGGGATLGQSDSYGLLATLRRELSRASIEVVAIQLVDCEIPLDYANSSSRATLWVLGPDGQIQRACESTLWNVNKEAAPLDRSLARRIEGSGEGGVDGLICISTDVQGVNREAILAATASGKPIVGTGGTSLGAAASLGAQVIGNSGGSVATTIQSKAVSFAASLAGYWKLDYSPLPVRLNVIGSMSACLPVFTAVMLAHRVHHELQHWLPGLFPSSLDLSGVLPLVVCVVVSSSSAGIGDMGVMAGLLAGYISQGRLITALVVGLLSGHLCRELLVITARSTRIPATASTIITVGVAGVASGLAGCLVRGPAEWVTGVVLQVLSFLEHPPERMAVQGLLGVVLGCGTFKGSQVGLYHRLMLPALLLEMERGQACFLGSLDLCTLVLTSAGICLGHLAMPHNRPRMTPLARRGAFINLMFGDFVEAAYPWIEDDRLVCLSAYVASALSTALLLQKGGLQSSAYLPLPISVWLGGKALLQPCLVALGIPFVATLVSNSIAYRLR